MSQKRIVYLTFYFKPDLCAGSFRNTPLVDELSKLAKVQNAIIDVYTTLPNRYSSYNVEAPEFESNENVNIYRVTLPVHKSGMIDQIKAFWYYYRQVIKLNKGKSADLVFASSSRLFTAFLGRQIASKTSAPLYLDIRDIFVDSMKDVLKTKGLRTALLPILRLIERVTFSNAKHINLISPGFSDYFRKYGTPNYSTFTNGIDDEFLQMNEHHPIALDKTNPVTIIYAGNIGEGQGLHRIIPAVAKKIGSGFLFKVIGDGGAKQLLVNEIQRLDLKNVKIFEPIKRGELKAAYNEADYLFLHLNDYEAFKKVLPSKVFELATFKKPIVAGVAGYSAAFIKEEVPDSFVFPPCNVESMADYLLSGEGLKSEIERTGFIEKFKRSTINIQMAESIIVYLK